MPEGEEEEQKIENLFEQIMKENFPNLAKEIDFQGVQEVQRVSKKLDSRRHILRHNIITLPKIKDKGRLLKAVREKDTITYKGVSIRLSADFSKKKKKPYKQEGAGKKYSKSGKARTYIQEYSIQKSYHLEWKGR